MLSFWIKLNTDEDSDSSRSPVVPSNHGAEETETASAPHFGITAIGIILKDLNSSFFLSYFIFKGKFILMYDCHSSAFLLFFFQLKLKFLLLKLFFLFFFLQFLLDIL